MYTAVGHLTKISDGELESGKAEKLRKHCAASSVIRTNPETYGRFWANGNLLMTTCVI